MANFLTTSLPAARKGEHYEAQISVAGMQGASSFSLIEGELPPSLTLDLQGWIRGTSAGAGVYGFTVSVTDAQSTITQDFEIRVVAPLPVQRPSQAGVRSDPVSGVSHIDNGRRAFIPALMCFSVPGVAGAIGSSFIYGASVGFPSIAGSVTGAASGLATVTARYQAIVANMLNPPAAIGSTSLAASDVAFDITGTHGHIKFEFVEDLRQLEILTHGRPFLTDVDVGNMASGGRVSAVIRDFIAERRIAPQRIYLNSCFSAYGGMASQAQVVANELNITTIGYKGRYFADIAQSNTSKRFDPMPSPLKARTARALNEAASRVFSAELYAERGVRAMRGGGA